MKRPMATALVERLVLGQAVENTSRLATPASSRDAFGPRVVQSRGRTASPEERPVTS